MSFAGVSIGLESLSASARPGTLGNQKGVFENCAATALKAASLFAVDTLLQPVRVGFQAPIVSLGALAITCDASP